jgi:hypothetical protein
MSMNIGPMLRALLGDSVPEGGKALELRIGQIVRGVLLNMLDDGEALINIGGVPVRARLEAELPAGRGTLLQVQSSSGGTVVLKPLAETAETIPDDTLRNALKTFGFPEQKWAYELLRGLRRDGVPIGKETAAFFREALSLKPPAEDASEWMNAAGAAFRRGLPVTETTIASLKQALFGPPMHVLWGKFASALREWAADGVPRTPQAQETASRLLALLAEGESLLSQAELGLNGRAAPAPQEAPASGRSLSSAADHAASGRFVPESGHGARAVAPQAPVPQSAAAPPPPAAQISAASAGTLPESPPTRTVDAKVQNPASDAVKLPRNDEAITGSREPDDYAADARATADSRIKAGPAPALSPREASWVGRLLQWLGVDHEHRLSGAMTAARQAGDSDMALPATDNLKSALLALTAQEDAPPALREAAQSLAGHITGQQLLLSPDRQANQPYSLMTLFVPMRSPDGDSTATVHVQTRRGRRGEWDSDNCRLLFDLRMPRLGDTIVDVQVANRIVSVKLMNDFPGMADLAESARDELEAGLSAAGFQLLSLSAVPLPSKETFTGDKDAKEAAAAVASSSAAAYAARPYRGVDYRV